LFGGRSVEHDISIISATSVAKALEPSKYEVVPIGITRAGAWWIGKAGEADLPAVLKHGLAVTPSANPSGPKFILLGKPASRLTPKIDVDVIFPVLHGTFGEDGTVQGLFELAGIPYVGAGVLGSSAGMDKDVMKRLFRDAGLPVVPWVLVFRNEWKREPMRVRRLIEKEIGYPLFVKPSNLGSSVGISKVWQARKLVAALDLAAQFDRKVLVEKAVNAREIECAVLGNERPEASVPGEVVPINEFYDYEAKYKKKGSKLVIPAKLSPHQTRRTRELAVRAFQAVDSAGMARVDLLLNRTTGKLFVNEINTIPGFTAISMYPKLWEASGLPYPLLLDRLIELAFERHREKRSTRYDHQSGS
jgi:D-alanine-D-alanine ligase